MSRANLVGPTGTVAIDPDGAMHLERALGTAWRTFPYDARLKARPGVGQGAMIGTVPSIVRALWREGTPA